MVFVKFSPGFPWRCHGLRIRRTFGAVRRHQTLVARYALLAPKILWLLSSFRPDSHGNAVGRIGPLGNITSAQRAYRRQSYSAEDSMVFVKFSPGFPWRCHGLHLARTFGAVRRRQTPVARLARLLAK